MSPPSTCPSCSSSEIERDDVNGHSQVICTSCGFICDEVSFSNEVDGEFYCPPTGPISTALGTQIKTHLKASDDVKTSQRRRQWVFETKKICKVQGLPENMTKEIVALFETAYQHPKFIMKHDKQMLSGACMYVVCRQSSWPILMKDIASTVQCLPHQIWAIVKLMMKELNIKVPPRVIEHHVPSILTKHRLTDPGLQKKAEGLFNLANETGLASGRHSEQVILAAGYLAWSSEQRKKQTIKSFVSILKSYVCANVLYQRVAELTDLVVMLAKEIPWIPKKHLKRESAHFLIDDVLQHKKMLIAKCKLKNSNVGQDSSNEENQGCFLPPVRIKRRNKNTSQDEPSCTVHHDMNSETLCDLDIPESDMHEYIYDPEDVAEREKILKEFRESDDNNHEELNSEENVDKEDTTVIFEVGEINDNVIGGNNEDENGDVVGRNNDEDENDDNIICESENFPSASITANELYNENKANSEHKIDNADKHVHPMKEIGSPNQLKRKAPLLPHSSDESSSKRPSKGTQRSKHMKISKQNITRLTRNRLQKTM